MKNQLKKLLVVGAVGLALGLMLSTCARAEVLGQVVAKAGVVSFTDSTNKVCGGFSYVAYFDTLKHSASMGCYSIITTDRIAVYWFDTNTVSVYPTDKIIRNKDLNKGKK